MRRLLAGLLFVVTVGGTAAVVMAPGVAGAVNPCDAPNPPASCNPPDPHGPSDPSGSLDQATRWPGGILVSGWANDRDRGGAAMTVFVRVGYQYGSGSQSTYITASLPRSDGAVGFQAVVPTTLSGNLSVCATALNVGAGTGDTAIGCRSVANVDHNPMGSLDEVTSGLFSVRVRGWAIDPDTASPITVHLYEDGAFLTAWTADVSRADVGAAYPGYGNLHGFDGVVPYPSTNGNHTICAYGINTSTGTVNSALGCRSWTEIHAPPVAPAIIELRPWQQPGDRNDQLTVFFQDNSTDETRFDILRQDPSGQWTVSATVTGSADTGVRSIDTGRVTPQAPYCFVVKAYTPYASSSSGTSCITTPALPPLAPDNLQVTASDPSSITLQWMDNSTDEQGFDVYNVVPNSGGRWTVGLTKSSHTGTGLVTATKHFLAPSTEYCFHVLAYNQRSGGAGGRDSAPSNDACGRTSAPNPPAAPSGLSITGHTQSSLSLGWTDNATDETGYHVEHQQGSTWVRVGNLGADAQSFTEAWLAAGITRCYRVVAINAGGEAASGTACGTTNTAAADLTVKNIEEMDYQDPTTVAGLLHAGDPFIMAWDVCNVGGADASSHETRLDLYDGQSTVSTTTVTVPQLPPGVCWRAAQPFDKGLATNQYDAVAMADSNGAVAETDEANNYFKYSFNIL